MITTPYDAAAIARSVLAVPPLARNADYSLNKAENQKIVRHLEAGGIRALLYGGNANFYHVPLSEYESLLAMLEEIAGKDTVVIPSAGPAYGTFIDQAKIARKFNFPTIMLLPQQGVTTSEGVANGVRRFVDVHGKPALLYIKHDGFIEPEDIAKLHQEKMISAIKYATVRNDPAKDDYLAKLVKVVDRSIIVSGIGEQPAIIHLRDFGVNGFTSGCVCIAPRLSMGMLRAIQSKDYVEAERIRQIFRGLEDLRNNINPIRVLHEAVRLAGVAETGPLLPLLTNVCTKDHPAIQAAAKKLLEADKAAPVAAGAR
jgi:dihydrodipicolinate synthase/N-acetylneuraminate lyase